MTVPVKEPRTWAEWQQAVDLAEWLLHLDAARQYGLITGGIVVNETRALEILARGKALGHLPAADCVERLTAEYMLWQVSQKQAGGEGRPQKQGTKRC